MQSYLNYNCPSLAANIKSFAFRFYFSNVVLWNILLEKFQKMFAYQLSFDK